MGGRLRESSTNAKSTSQLLQWWSVVCKAEWGAERWGGRAVHSVASLPEDMTRWASLVVLVQKVEEVMCRVMQNVMHNNRRCTIDRADRYFSPLLHTMIQGVTHHYDHIVLL